MIVYTFEGANPLENQPSFTHYPHILLKKVLYSDGQEIPM